MGKGQINKPEVVKQAVKKYRDAQPSGSAWQVLGARKELKEKAKAFKEKSNSSTISEALEKALDIALKEAN